MMIPQKVSISILLYCIAATFCTPAAVAHGTRHEVIRKGVVGIRAMYDDGTPIARAKTLVFPPGETEAAFHIMTDKDGTACFRPDQPGIWTLQVRAANGHGMRINLDVDDTGQITEKPTPGKMTVAQKTVMTLCVVWGLLGTALFAKSRV